MNFCIRGIFYILDLLLSVFLLQGLSNGHRHRMRLFYMPFCGMRLDKLKANMKKILKKILYASTIWELKKYRTEDEVFAEQGKTVLAIFAGYAVALVLVTAWLLLN